MPNVMVALPNIGGTLCSTPQSLADAQTRVPCSNAAKTRNPLKIAVVPQTTGPISAASRPKFAILWEHVEEMYVCMYISFGQGSSLLWTHTLRPLYSRHIAQT